MRFVFICGCPRSGTTTTANLVRSHDLIAMGRERYQNLFQRTKSVPPELFQKDRFCHRLMEGDTHHETLGEYYEQLSMRFETCTHIGDKLPRLFLAYNYVAATYPECKILFLVRNIFDVACSFERRRRYSIETPGASWPATQGYRNAVEDWNNSMSMTLRWRSLLNIKVVDFERLYVDDGLRFEILDFLGLADHPKVKEFWEQAKIRRHKLDAARKSTLSDSRSFTYRKTRHLMSIIQSWLCATEHGTLSKPFVIWRESHLVLKVAWISFASIHPLLKTCTVDRRTI